MPKVALLGIILSLLIMGFLFFLLYSLNTHPILITNPNFDQKTPSQTLCSDFKSNIDAQNFFNSHGGSAGLYKSLDKDHDGLVCESLR